MPNSSTGNAPTPSQVSPQSILDAPVNLFAGVLNTAPVKVFTIAEALTLIQNGTYRPEVQRLQSLLTTKGEKAYKAAKTHLDAVTFCGTFSPTRNIQNLTQHSGIIHGDLDDLLDVQTIKAQLCADPHTVYCFTSPSGSGLKVGLSVAIIDDDATYKLAWQAAADYHHNQYGIWWDTSGKDVSRLCFLSDDPDVYVNPDPVRFVVPATAPASAPPPQYRPVLPTLTLDDSSLLDKARQAKSGAKLTRLWSGDATGYSSQSEADFALCCMLVWWTRHDPARVDRLFRQSVLSENIDRHKNPEDYLERTISNAMATETDDYDPQAHLQVSGNDTAAPQQTSSTAAATPPTGSGSGSGLPDIIIGPDITRLVDEAQAALRALPDAPVIYQRARRLCVIAQGVKPPRWLHRPQDMPVILEASPGHLWELAGQAAQWWKLDKRVKKTKTYEQVLPPRWCIEALQGRDGWPFPLLEGIVYSPTLRPNGSLLNTPGYDPDTGLFLDTNGTAFPPIPAYPTLDDARTAIGCLQEPVINFPFAEPWYFSATLAAVLSLVCRFTILGNVPLFAIRANTRGSGKSLLADVVSVIGTGRAAPRWPQVTEDEEERKRLLTVALAGYPVIHIDNVTKPLGSPALDLALTATSFSDRILGKNDSREAPLSMVWLASGNNMQFQGDTARRILPIDLDPKMERPEERTGFQHSPLVPWVQQERPRFTIAALTIVKAYFVAGCPSQGVTPYGSFEQWSDLIRQALIWAGEADPCEGRKNIEAESDPQYERLATLLDAWTQCYPKNDAWTLAQVWADIQTRATFLPNPPNAWNTLQAALGAFQPKYDGKSLDTRVLGDAFRTFQSRTLAGRRFVKGGLSHHAQRWAIEQV